MTLRNALTWVCLGLLLSACPAMAEIQPGTTIDADTARQVAARHLQAYPAPIGITISNIHEVRSTDANQCLAWQIDLEPTGYIIVSASKTTAPVIAYSFTSEAGNPTDSNNPLMNLVREDLILRGKHAASISSDAAQNIQQQWSCMTSLDAPLAPQRGFRQWPEAGTTPTGGWLLENWNQSAPYNNLCPMDLGANQRSVAGCPSIAMAMILDYHKRLNGKVFTDADDYYHNYGSNQYWVDNHYATYGFPSFPQLNGYLDEVVKDYFNGDALAGNDKAAIVFACGVAARQVYSAGGSGTFSVSQAKEAYDEFHCTTAELLDDSDFNVYQRLAQNMQQAFPAHLAIVNPTWTAGHNVVVDGYNTNDYFHINFGWGGVHDGWYLLPSELPYDLTVLEGVIVDIMTDKCDAMDANCDGSIDLTDYAFFTDCLAAPGITYTAPGCITFDLDSDADVDLADFAKFQAAFEE